MDERGNSQRGEVVSIRPYREEDRAAVLALASRLAVGIAPWRSVEGMEKAARDWTEASISGIGAERAVFVAEREDRAVIGFASVARQVEFTGEPQAYVGEFAVAEAAEGAGVGRALLGAIETWAQAQGLSLIVLETGAGNSRARRFYSRGGFVEEGVRLTKLVNGQQRQQPSTTGKLASEKARAMPAWRIESMVDHPDLIERIAEWLWSEWGHHNPARTPASWADELRQRSSRDAIPTTYVALAGEELLGSVSLMVDDLETRRDLSPWLGELFVAPAARGQGVGSALVRHAVRAAGAMGIGRLYLQTNSAQELYERLGWQPIADERHKGEQVTVMMLDLSP